MGAPLGLLLRCFSWCNFRKFLFHKVEKDELNSVVGFLTDSFVANFPRMECASKRIIQIVANWQSCLYHLSVLLFCSLVRSETIVFGRTYVLPLMFFSFQSRDLRDALADRREIFHGDQYSARFCSAGPKFREVFPPKKFRAKTCQIWSDFGQLRNSTANILEQIKIFKIGQVCDLPRFLRRSAKKCGKLWYNNFGDLEV